MYQSNLYPNTGLGIAQDYCLLDCNNAFDIDPGFVSIDGDYLPIKEIIDVKTQNFDPYPFLEVNTPIFNDLAISNSAAVAVSNNFDAFGNALDTVFIQPNTRNEVIVTPTNVLDPISFTPQNTTTEAPFTEIKTTATPETSNYAVPVIIIAVAGLLFLITRKKSIVTNN